MAAKLWDLEPVLQEPVTEKRPRTCTQEDASLWSSHGVLLQEQHSRPSSACHKAASTAPFIRLEMAVGPSQPEQGTGHRKCCRVGAAPV